jgi:hypothetical protein
VIPGLNNLFKVVSLSPGQWGVVLMASFSIIPVAEVIKLFLNLKGKKTNPKT